MRRKYTALAGAVSPPQRRREDNAILQVLTATDAFHDCETLLTYVSAGAEVDTTRLIEYALSQGKTVAVPRCGSEPGRMSFYVINAVRELVRGKFGLPEPPAGARLLDKAQNALCVVPALAYDADGYRLGRGGGYYDRFLAGFTGCTVGLCRVCCISNEALPRGEHDIKVGHVITQKGVLRKDK